MIKVFVPIDSASAALGANRVAKEIASQALARSVDIEIIRNSSRGLFFLEPLIEVEISGQRFAYGPVTVASIASLFEAGFLEGRHHSLSLGEINLLPYLAKQERLTFARMGVSQPLSLIDYQRLQGFVGLKVALDLLESNSESNSESNLDPVGQDAIIAAITESGLRGRGGAAFPAGIKWKTVKGEKADQKFIVCNADEGDSGTYSDRMTLEGDPYMLIEGMAIAALAVGATQGYIYIRSEYPAAVKTMRAAIQLATDSNFIGVNICGTTNTFHLEVRVAAGSYVCGEETAMLESIEGKRGIVRAKPPLPAIAGLFGKPTVINNVITLACVPFILANGAAAYRDYGMGRSRGTLPIQLSGNIKNAGLVEKAFGITLRELLFDFGGGSASGRPIKAVQVGGPLGAYIPESQWDLPLDYEAFAAVGAVVGHGGIVVHDDTANLAELAQYAMEFCAIESCGKCTPCRIGSTRGVEVIDKIRQLDKADFQTQTQVTLLRSLCDTMINGSLCAMGSMTPYPVLSALKYYPQDFGLIEGDPIEQSQ
jgi:formate dehydrogenase iron-sulfur subunit